MDEPVTIVGAGIVGICCALSLQDRGIQATLIDRGAPGQETSFGNAGVISPWSIIPQAVPGIWKSIPGMLLSPSGPLSVHPRFWPKMVPWGLKFLAKATETATRAGSDAMDYLCAPSVDLYRQHLAGTGHEDLIVDSWYVHAFRNAKQANLSDISYAIRQQKGAALERIDAADLRSLEPALSPAFKAAILIKGQARARAPGRIATVLAEKFVSRGGAVSQHDIKRVSKTDTGVWHLDTDNCTLTTKKLIIASGVWSADFLKPLGLTLPLVAERGYHVAFPNAGTALTNSVMDVNAKIVASSMEDGLRVAGSSEFAAIDAPADLRKKALLQRQAKSMMPDLDLSDTQFWMGRRPSFPDSLPAIGAVSGHVGLYTAFGHSHYGLMMAPKTGELIADLLSGHTPNVDLTPYDPMRF